MAATFNLVDEFYNDLLKGEHTFGAAGDTFKIMLSSTAPTKATNAIKDDVDAGIVTGGSYADVSVGGTGKLSITEPSTGVWQIGDTDDVAVFSAVSTDFTGARYAYLYNSTNADKLVGVLDYGATFVVTAGNSFTVDPGTDGYVKFTTPTWA